MVAKIWPGQSSMPPPAQLDDRGENNTPAAINGCGVKNQVVVTFKPIWVRLMWPSSNNSVITKLIVYTQRTPLLKLQSAMIGQIRV